MTKQNARSVSQHLVFAVLNLDKIRSRIMTVKVKGSTDDSKFKEICKLALVDCNAIERRIDDLQAYIVENVPDIGFPDDE